MTTNSAAHNGKLNKKWVFFYSVGCLVASGICVMGSVKWWFEGPFLNYLSFCGLFISFALLLQTTSFSLSKYIAKKQRDISSRTFLGTVIQVLGSNISVSISVMLVGLGLLTFGMMVWKTYSQFLGAWLGVCGVGYMVVMPLLHWTNPRHSSDHRSYRYR